jgi:hypothetical protein
MRRFLSIGLVALFVLPLAVHAQRKKDTYVVFEQCCWANRWMLETYGGVVKDSYTVDGPKSNTGFLLGAHVAFRISPRTRALGNVAYSNVSIVGNSDGLPNFYTYNDVWVVTTVGGEFDVVPGRTSAAIGLQGGIGWRQLAVDDTIGVPIVPPVAEQNFTATIVLVPSLTVRYWITNRTGMSAAFTDHMFNVLEGPTLNSPSLTLAVMFR